MIFTVSLFDFLEISVASTNFLQIMKEKMIMALLFLFVTCTEYSALPFTSIKYL